MKTTVLKNVQIKALHTIAERMKSLLEGAHIAHGSWKTSSYFMDDNGKRIHTDSKEPDGFWVVNDGSPWYEVEKINYTVITKYLALFAHDVVHVCNTYEEADALRLLRGFVEIKEVSWEFATEKYDDGNE